jgi:hypothetical protein
MGEACSIHGRDKKCTQHFGKHEGKHLFEDLGTDGRIILKCILNEQDMIWSGFIGSG